MATDPPEAVAPTTPGRGAREGRVRATLSIGATVVLLTSYFTAWWHVVDGSPPAEYPFVPGTMILNPYQGFSLNAALLMVGLPLLSALFAFLTLRGSHEARRLFATFGLMTSFFCLALQALSFWGDERQVTDAGGYVGYLAILLIFGVSLSLSIALPKESTPRAGDV